MKRRAFALLAIGLTLVGAGCGGTPRRTMTGSEAIERLDGYLKGAVDAASTSLHMVRTKAEADDDGGCSKSAFYDDFTGQVQAVVTYDSFKASPDAATQYFDVVAQLWERQYGHVDRSDGHLRVLIDDGKFTLYGNNFWPGPHQVQLSGTSGCVWVNGTPGPEDNP